MENKTELTLQGRLYQSADNDTWTESSTGLINLTSNEGTFDISTSSQYIKPNR